jgi:hypothetical protein
MDTYSPLGGVFDGWTPLDCVHRQGGAERYEATWIPKDGRKVHEVSLIES